MRWSSKERWCLAAAAQPVASRDGSHEWPGGAPRLDRHVEAAREALASEELGSAADVTARLLWLEEEGHASELDADDDPELREAVAAFDLVSRVDLAGLAYLAGFLTIDEAWRLALEAAAVLKSSFASWEALGNAYLVGLELVSGEVASEDVERLAFLLEDPCSPWRRTPFDADWKKGTRSYPAGHGYIRLPEPVMVAQEERTWELTVEQRRAQGLWAVMALTDFASLSRLGGWPRTDGFTLGLGATLGSHGIANREELLARLEPLAGKSSTSSSALDSAWAVTFANWGFVAGYLEEREAWDWIARARAREEVNRRSWEEFGRALLDDELVRFSTPNPMHVAAVERLLADPQSPWRLLGWFGATPAHDPERAPLECVTFQLSLACPACTREISVPRVLAEIECAGCTTSVQLDPAYWEYLLARDASAARRLSGSGTAYRFDLGALGRSRRRYTRGPLDCAACRAPLALPVSPGDLACAKCGARHRLHAADRSLLAIDEDAVGLLEHEPEKPPPGTFACASCGSGVTARGGERTTTCAKCNAETIVPLRIAFALEPRPAAFRIVRAQGPLLLDVPAPPRRPLTAGDAGLETAGDRFAREGGNLDRVRTAPWEGFARTTAERFVLALNALDLTFLRGSYALLGGRVRGADSARQAAQRLRAYWMVESRDDLLQRLKVWTSSGARAEYQAYLDWLSANPGPWTAAQLAPEEPDKRRKWGVVLDLVAQGKERGIAALDAHFVIGVAGDGYVVGWLSAEETWDAMRAIARVVQESYSSWDEMIAYQLAGRRFVGYQIPARTLAVAEELLADPVGPFRTVPWQTALGSSALSPEPHDAVRGWLVRLSVDCRQCGVPVAAWCPTGETECARCGDVTACSLERACDVLRAPLDRARLRTAHARLELTDLRGEEVFHVDLQRNDPACPYCRAPLPPAWSGASCGACTSSLLVMTTSSHPALERLHPRLVCVVCPPETRGPVEAHGCASCGAKLAWRDARFTECRYCGARNFMGDALRASLFGRSAPREVLVLVGAEESRPSPEGEDAWRINTPLLVAGEPVLVGST